MEKFKEGWWNCFCSYTDNMYYYSTGGDLRQVAYNQLNDASVSQIEIEEVLKNIAMTESTRSIIETYSNEIAKKSK